MNHDGWHVEPQSSHVATYSVWPTDVESPHLVAAVLLHAPLDVMSAFELQPYEVPNGVLQL